uniref:uncharacterized protein LOC122588563 n=1 Tax=Erigeron canadensis TaxID=72917 RepID=UPI001CB93686|nr:uncharacterized protein LOC122588563 [Erigeron canadensis]
MSKEGIKITESTVIRSKLTALVDKFFPGKISLFKILSDGDTVLTPPDGYVGFYLQSASEGNVRYPFSAFMLEVLDFFEIHISTITPLGLSRIIAFEVMCRAYGGEPSLDLFRYFVQTCPSGDWATVGNRSKAGCFKRGGLDIRDWKSQFVFMRSSLIPKEYESVTDKKLLCVHAKYDNPFPDYAVDTLCREIWLHPITVVAYPDVVLYKAKLIPSLPGGVNIDDMTFRKFVRKGVKEVTVVPRIERQGSGTADAPSQNAGSSGVHNDNPEVQSAADPPILNVDYSDVEVLEVFATDKKKKKKSAPSASVPQSVAGRLKRRKVGDEAKDSEFRKPSSPKTALHDQEILNWLNGDNMNAKDVKKIDNMDNETFLKVFKKDRQFHAYLDAVAARRFSRMAIDLRSKSLEVHLLTATVEDLKAREARFVTTVEASDLVQSLRQQLNMLKANAVVHEESLAKLQKEVDQEKENSCLLRDQVDLLKVDRARVVTKVIPYVSKSLLYSDEVEQLLGDLTSAERANERSTLLEEFLAEGKCDLTCRGDFVPNASHELEVADHKWKEVVFPFLEKVVTDPHAAVEDLLKIVPDVIQPEDNEGPQ